MNNNKEWF